MSPKAVYLCFEHEFYPGSIGDWFHCIIQGWAESVRCGTLFENGSDAKQFFTNLRFCFIIFIVSVLFLETYTMM